MISGVWSVALTAVFVVTGGYCLWQWVSTLQFPRGRRPDARLVTHFNHLLMSVAMVLMVWMPAGRTGTWLQVAVFGVLGVIFGYHVFRSEQTSERVAAVVHLAMNAAMIWMLAAMPLLMAGTAGDGTAMSHAGHAGHHSSGADSMAMGAGAGTTPTWANGANWAAVGLLVVGAGWWLAHAVRQPGHRVECSCHAAMCAGMAAMLVVMNGAP